MTALTMRGAARSDAGRRANNEDAVFCSPRLAAVADGVGGSAAGEVASHWAINKIAALDRCRLVAPLDLALQGAVSDANATVGFLVECRPQWRGMATTLTAVALSNEGDYLVTNVGDSRAYLFRDSSLRCLTRDDSLVQELVEHGAITAEQARVHPQRSIVLKALDGGEPALSAPVRHPARLGDRLLLCSDGVSDALDDDEIGIALRDASDRGAAAETLVAYALAAGSRDNVSAIVIDVVARADTETGWLTARRA